jgi:DNA modification methylase
MIQKDLLPLACPISKLSLLPGNPRRGDVEAVKASLEKFGQRKPIVVRKSDQVVIAGNHTLQAAQALGWSEIAVVWVDDDDTMSKAFALADNRTAELGDYDEEALAALIGEVGALDPELLEATGWDSKSVSELLDKMQTELPADVDEVREDVPAISKLGDVWLLGEHRVMCGDSTDEGTVLRLVNDQVINVVFTDPPYGINIEGDRSKRGGLAQGGKFKNFKDDSTVYAEKAFDIVKTLNVPTQIWFGANYYAHHLPQSNNWLVWDKRLEDIQRDTQSDCELAWIQSKYNSVRIFRHLWKGMIKGSEHSQKRVHPTQKPIALPIWCFDEYDCGNIVLDLFGGSGSTLIAAEQTKRIAYLMELDPHYVDVICARYQKHTGVLPVLESDGLAHDFSADV